MDAWLGARNPAFSQVKWRGMVGRRIENWALVKVCCLKTGRDERWAGMGQGHVENGFVWLEVLCVDSKQLLKWLAPFKLRSQNHPPTSRNDDSAISGVRRQISGSVVSIKACHSLVISGWFSMCASFNNKPDQVSHRLWQWVPGMFVANNFLLHSV